MAACPHRAALRGRYGSDIRRRIPDRRLLTCPRLHASISRSLAPLRVLLLKKGIFALLVAAVIAVLLSPRLIGHIVQQSINDSLERPAAQNGHFVISISDFVRGWFSSVGKYRVELLHADMPQPLVLLVETRLDHGLVPVSSLSRKNATLMPGLGSAVSTLDQQFGDGSIEPLPITIFTHIGLTGALQSRVYIEGSGSGPIEIDLALNFAEPTDALPAEEVPDFLSGSARLVIPEALVNMATQVNPDLHGLVGLGYLRKRGDFYVTEASIEDGALTVNGAPMPIPLPGL